MELLGHCSSLRRRLCRGGQQLTPEQLARLDELRPHVQTLELRAARVQSAAKKHIAGVRAEVTSMNTRFSDVKEFLNSRQGTLNSLT